MRTVHLIGGGWDSAATASLYGPFLDSAGPSPSVATVVLDEGDGQEQFRRWEAVLRRTAPCEPVPVLVALGGALAVDQLADADAVLVCGGLTPAYAAALAPAADALSRWLADADRPYAGFSAGAAVAPRRALVGGWRQEGTPVCPEDAAEDLEDVSVVPGLGLLDGWLVDVHCAQWGTLPRLIAAVQAERLDGVAVDEDTALHLDGEAATVAGLGAVRHVAADVGNAAGPGGAGVRVMTLRSGARLRRP